MRWPALSMLMAVACRNIDPPHAHAPPLFDVTPEPAQLGFDAPFSIVLRVAASDRPPADVRWKQVAGPQVRDVAIGEGGLRFSARMPRIDDIREGPLPWGVVPFSPRTRAEVEVDVEWRHANDDAPHRERITVAAAARSRGLPNLPLDERIYFGGTGWRIQEAPPDARARIEAEDGVSLLRPDARGIWQLVDGEGRQLRIQAGRYVETPLDCGRSDCHQAIAHAAQSSPMTWSLAHRLQDPASEHAAPDAARSSDGLSCAMPCHVTGEPGIHDGGFFDVAATLGFSPAFAGVRDLAQLPRALRRLGSVGCLACHGPSALPEADARWSILRSDVCAHCHDAPPRYGHAVAWQSTNMAHADQDRRAASDSGCAACHTTWGFLRAFDASPGKVNLAARIPPVQVGGIGITCPACHAVHDTEISPQKGHGLLRTPRLAALFEEVPADARSRSGTCLACHAPGEAGPLPQASAAALWAGRAGIDPQTGAPLTGPAPHRPIDGGCVGCHRDGPKDVERGASHGFRAAISACATCHADATRAPAWSEERAEIEKAAHRLWDQLLALGAIARSKGESAAPPAGPPHANNTGQRDRDTPLGRAAYDLALLLEDPGFLAHNLPYARLLLDKARAPIERASGAVTRRTKKSETSWGR